jgi:hypothetical protein
MKSITSLELTRDIDRLLSEICVTGMPIEINWQGKYFRIVPTETTGNIEKKSRLDNLIRRPDVIVGNSDDLVNISWEHEINLDLP